MKVRLFFATDVHGSEVCWRKFINSAKHYEVDVLILGGDMTGKAIVPIVENGARPLAVSHAGSAARPAGRRRAGASRAPHPRPRLLPGRHEPRRGAGVLDSSREARRGLRTRDAAHGSSSGSPGPTNALPAAASSASSARVTTTSADIDEILATSKRDHGGRGQRPRYRAAAISSSPAAGPTSRRGTRRAKKTSRCSSSASRPSSSRRPRPPSASCSASTRRPTTRSSTSPPRSTGTP